MAFSLKQAFLTPQHDHQTSCWSGTYIILINSLRFKEECLCNCMELHRNSPWTPHISFSVCKLWAAHRRANSFCWAALHHLFGKEFFPSPFSCSLWPWSPVLLPIYECYWEALSTDWGDITTGGTSKRKCFGCQSCELAALMWLCAFCRWCFFLSSTCSSCVFQG